jgi:hypothetical protein
LNFLIRVKQGKILLFQKFKAGESEFMPLTFRATQPKDFPQCLEIAHERFLFKTPESRKELFNFWRKVLDDRSVMSIVVEEIDRPVEKRIVGFLTCFFAGDDFAREMRTTLPPFLAPQVIQRWKKGNKHSPFQNHKALAQQNTRGALNITVLHYGVEPRETFELEAPIRIKIPEAYLSLYGGFQINQYLHEVYGLDNRDIMSQAGSLIRRDYAEFMYQSPLARDHRPFLTGIDRMEAMKQPNVIGILFAFAPPRFGFSQGEQDVLEKAFLGEIDRNIAPALGLTVWAVDKRWQGIYAKVEKVDHSLLGPMGKKNDAEYQKTRRKYLLDYLRTHLEELRPYVKAPQPKKKKTGKS